MGKDSQVNGAISQEIDIDQAAADPRLVASMAINDVIELARALTKPNDFSRGAVEMRRRLAVMDLALAAAEKAGLVAGEEKPSVQ